MRRDPRRRTKFLTVHMYSVPTVCIKTLDKFSATLSEAQKKDPKLIEAEFKKFCKVQKNKENRFVSSPRRAPLPGRMIN